MTLPAVLSILVESHEDTRTTGLTGTLPSKTLNLPVGINRVILQRSQFLPIISLCRENAILLMLMLDLLRRSISLLLSLFGTTFKTENQLHSRILGNIVIYQSVVISTADSGMEGRVLVYRLDS